MDNVINKYWPVLKVCQCLDKKSREKIFEKLAYEKDFRKLMKAFMRHVCNQDVKVSKISSREKKRYREAILRVGQSSKKLPQKTRRKYIRQIGGAFPFLIPILASVVGEILTKVV